MASSPQAKAVSAPGKVLLAGGYLVLDREYTGLVFGLNARIHVVVQPLPTQPSVSLQEIIVKSPQFHDAIWQYGYRQAREQGGVEVTQLNPNASGSLRRNPFVETALSYALTYISSLAGANIEAAYVSILADNDYYSQTVVDTTPQRGNGRFKDFGVSLWDAHKTGLGSSAALVTAFTAALLVHYLPEKLFSLSTEDGRMRLHNLAQAAHCAAQGKVGSGFDVASAVFGSSLYRRFSPSLLSSHGEPGSSEFAARLKILVEDSSTESKWDTEIIKSAVKIPPGVRLVMCDVDCGSQTPGMVKQVLSWRKSDPTAANLIWDPLQKSNEAFAAELVRLADNGSRDYSALKTIIGDIRSLIRDMTDKTGVAIEPKEQTALLDAFSEIPGVIGGVVPGAGGYDAVALLIEDKPEVIQRLQNFMSEFKALDGMKIGKVSMLGVREDMEGVRTEDLSTYEAWI